ncbi:MAG TPA: sigma-70 family RNA polymerase sigma factor [Acidimicrobiales bacterium]|jgi:RNA polymerase sigma factor (sigma-70 family)|nr:sigma-70 family RNA polymerase sigma factor [Acidimicrobiales bacterium]
MTDAALTTPCSTATDGDRDPGREVATLVQCAASGDPSSWSDLVDRFNQMLMAVCRSTGLQAADVADVCQTTWSRLLQNLDRIEHPERVGAWLATTARRESIRVRERAKRAVPHDEVGLTALPGTFDLVPPDTTDDKRDRLVRQLYADLPEQARTLLSLLLFDPPLSYKELSEALDMPIGSIGPTRRRILAKLRRQLEQRGVTALDALG